MADSKKLFGDFSPVTDEQWTAQAIKDLKGQDFEKLIWESPDGLTIKPFYTANDTRDIAALHIEKADNNWEICQPLVVCDAKSANTLAHQALMSGATGIDFDLRKVPHNEGDFNTLLKGILPEFAGLHIQVTQDATAYATHFASFLKQHSITKEFVPTFSYDTTGEINTADITTHKAILEAFKELPLVRCLAVNGASFNNKGASAIQELALSIAMAAEFISQLNENGFSNEQLAERIHFRLGVGSNFFLEIAKLRALRLLWTDLLSSFESSTGISTYLKAESSSWNKTIYDPHNNLLRGTTETLAAAVSSVDSIATLPFDSVYEDPTAFSTRLSRNISLLLKHESYVDKALDPAAGSYYIEALTQELVNKAWEQFELIEKQGGYLECFTKGIVQKQLEEAAEKRQQMLASRRQVLIGVNQYPNYQEQRKNGATGEVRAASGFEELRLKVDAMKTRPKVLLFTFGNLTMRRARAAFATNFFACGGFSVIDHNGYPDIESGLAAIQKEKPDYVILCSSDEEYPALAAELVKHIDKFALVVAGYPKEFLSALENTGISHYIHVKSNLLEELKRYVASLK